MLKRTWRFVDRILSWGETVLILGLLGTVLGIAFAQVPARMLGGGWLWADELVRYMVLWLGVIGAGAATRYHKHIAIDALTLVFPAKLKGIVRRLTDLVAAAVVLWLAKATRDYIYFVGDEISATLGVAIGTLTWPIAVGFVWIGLRFLADAIFGVAPKGHGPGIDASEFEETLADNNTDSNKVHA